MNLTLQKNHNLLQFLLGRYAILFIFLLLFTASASAQFSVTVVSTTDESCPGNGTMTLAAQNADPSVPVTYMVYLLPNTTTPVWNSTNPNVIGLGDGTYQIVAKQTIGGTDVFTAPQQAVIADNTSSVTYTTAGDDAVCGPDGSITVTITSGTAVTYEILTGPVTRPPQASPTFNNLPAGIYTIRVIDPCGFGIVQTFTLLSAGPQLDISDAIFPDIELPACNLITARHHIANTTFVPIQYPITATYTVYPPGGGAPIVFTQTLNAGDPEDQDIDQIIPFYYGQNYHYTFTLSDPCNTYGPYQHDVDATFTLLFGFDNAGCDGKYLILTLNKFVAPYTVTFNSGPPGFDPEDFNEDHPGPFTAAGITYGNPEQAVPYGTYVVSITDACGRSVNNMPITLEEPEIDPEVSPHGVSCAGPGWVEISLPGIVIAEAYITEAPDDYPDPLPDDVIEFWEFEDEMLLTIPDLVGGDYVIYIVDECGREFGPLEFNISQSANVQPVLQPRVDCTEGMGTVRIAAFTPPITSVIITTAPAAFPYPLPYDASANILEAQFYMDNLPPGVYKFDVTDNCQTFTNLTQTITGYAVTINEMEVTRHCGSFDLSIEHASNAYSDLAFWLQKYNEGTGQWGHPGTGVPYVEGTPPIPANSLLINNNTTNYSIPYSGKFRVLKSYSTYNSGSTGEKFKACVQILHETIPVPEGISIDGIVNLSCEEDSADIMILANGVEPLTYTIVSKNGQPFTLNNGTSNTFFDLEPATYSIVVEDPCGRQEPETFNVAELPPLVVANQPADLSPCDTGNDNVELFNLSLQTPIILGTQDPDLVTITYHATQANAETGANPLPLTYTTGNTTIYARAVNSLNLDCYKITSFDITLLAEPEVEMRDTWPMCEGGNVRIIADEGFASYQWSTGSTAQSITVNQSGTYTLTVTTAEGCSATKNIEVVTSVIPHIAVINISDWTDNNNTISVVVEPSAQPQDFEYSIDGENYQDDPNFYNLGTGPYTVYVRDKYECGFDEGEVYLLTYPKFFTPNGDGINEKWRIEFSLFEPNMLVYIYDRFGKVVCSFGANSEGWDGTFNGSRLPATDYWFVVKRENGQEMKGHFSMIR